MKGSIFWDVTVPRMMSAYAGTVFVLLWLGFFAALVFNQNWQDVLWNWVQGLPIIPRVLIWVVLTPVLTLLWVWQSPWSTLGKVTGYTGVIAWTLVAASSVYKAFR